MSAIGTHTCKFNGIEGVVTVGNERVRLGLWSWKWGDNCDLLSSRYHHLYLWLRTQWGKMDAFGWWLSLLLIPWFRNALLFISSFPGNIINMMTNFFHHEEQHQPWSWWADHDFFFLLPSHNQYEDDDDEGPFPPFHKKEELTFIWIDYSTLLDRIPLFLSSNSLSLCNSNTIDERKGEFHRRWIDHWVQKNWGQLLLPSARTSLEPESRFGNGM